MKYAIAASRHATPTTVQFPGCSSSIVILSLASLPLPKYSLSRPSLPFFSHPLAPTPFPYSLSGPLSLPRPHISASDSSPPPFPQPSPVLLVPVVKALRTLEKIQDSFGKAPSTDAAAAADSLRKADSSLSAAPFVPAKELKRVLNAYSDNIYTDDTSRYRFGWIGRCSMRLTIG